MTDGGIITELTSFFSVISKKKLVNDQKQALPSLAENLYLRTTPSKPCGALQNNVLFKKQNRINQSN